MTVGQLKRIIAEYADDDEVLIFDSESGDYIPFVSADLFFKQESGD